MNIVMWILAGGILGWIGFAALGYNEERGMKVSVIIGSVGGLLGGKLIAPVFSGAAAVPGDVGVPALLFAVAGAAVFLFVGNLVHNRWNV
jgi:uncharacterized membrane protein YeaQ/YmgE (transglycosylase-associated protein family)